MGSQKTRVMAVRVDIHIQGLIAAMAKHERATLSRYLRQAIQIYLHLSAIERARLFAVELTMTRGELRRIGGLFALRLKSKSGVSPELEMALKGALLAVITAIDAGIKVPETSGGP